ncbi:MAG: hypothetical protein Q9219_006383 [cf. Caloplaca sp. 3 TL-2023]
MPTKKRPSPSNPLNEDYAPKAKKPKPTTTTASSNKNSNRGARAAEDHPQKKKTNGDEGEEFWEISPTRRISLSSYKGATMLHLREYYHPDKDNKTKEDMLPGKKGISLPLAQYSALLTLLPEIEAALVRKGEKVARPVYEGGSGGGGDEVEGDNTVEEEEEREGGSRDKKGQERKQNHEATSDEEE